MAAKNQRRRRVLAVTHTNFGCFREVIQGISLYGNSEGRWNLEICQPHFDPVGMIESINPDGLLLGATDDIETARRAAKLVRNCVVVCRGYTDPLMPLPAADADEVAIGQMGAEHLLAKGFRNYAFVGQLGTLWSRVRQNSFVAAVKLAGFTAPAYEVEWGLIPKEPHRRELNEWLLRLPKPVAILACNDSAAGLISRFCLDLGLRVPDDVAILGVDNDDLCTATSNPPLSSVVIPWRAMGRAASVMLDRLMDGEAVEPVVKYMAPTGVCERQSTGGVAIEDEQVRTAIRFMREHAGTQITIDDVVTEAQTTRRALERKFRTTLGRSPLEELRQFRVQRAKLLLSQTDLTIKQVARQSGFGSLTWFTTAFSKITGATPAKYREFGEH